MMSMVGRRPANLEGEAHHALLLQAGESRSAFAKSCHTPQRRRWAHDCRLDRLPPARRGSRQSLYLRAFRKTERVLDINAEVADCALDLHVTEQDLDRA